MSLLHNLRCEALIENNPLPTQQALASFRPALTPLANGLDAGRNSSPAARLGSTYPADFGETKDYFEKLALFPRRDTGPSFTAKELDISLSKTPRWRSFMKDTKKVAFGHEYTDHMLKINWTKERGWGTPRIMPFENLKVHPAAKVLHYAVAAFEGMKAFRGDDGTLRVFRPWHNMFRLTTSASRSCLPLFDEKECLDVLLEFLKIEQNWVPSKDDLGPGSSLYIRPALIGTSGHLGLDVGNEACLFVVLSPVQSYFSGGVTQIKLLADPRFIRSEYGGWGDCKISANYAPAFRIQEEAVAMGYQGVLWLYGEQNQVTEAGMMNVFFFLENDKGEKELVTPPLDGLILPGCTRRSILDLARSMKDKDFKVSERIILMKEVAEAANKGKLFECFGTGTAAVIVPIVSIDWRDNCKIDIPTMSNKELMWKNFLNEITDIQYGRKQHEWCHAFG